MNEVNNNWGGKRYPGPGKTLGRSPIPPEEKRVKVSLYLAPGVRELCKEIAQQRGYPGWSHAIDEAIVALARQMGIEV